jgi:hypothetical protein
LTWLKASVDAGLEHPDRVAEDPELAPLHGPELDALLHGGGKAPAPIGR